MSVLMRILHQLFFVFLVSLGTIAAQAEEPSLWQAARSRFPIGAAVTSYQVSDPKTVELILRQFNCLTAEYEFMPQFLEPSPGVFTFDRADRVAAFAAAHHLPLTGHMLCWNQLTPQWMFAEPAGKPLSRQAALDNLRLYIDTVVKHFRGKVDSWNVVNEAISDVAGEYLKDTPAKAAIGDDYIMRAFEFAHAADPTVSLYYNDYNIEDPVKLPKTLRLIHSLKASGVKLDAVGIQGHWLLNFPKAEVIDSAIGEFGKAGVKVMITELDVDVLPRSAAGADLNSRQIAGANPYANGIPPAVLQQQAQRYAELFRVFDKHTDVLTRVTFWGVDDGQSWLNDYPVKGRTNYPLLFDRRLLPKPAFQSVIDVLNAQ